SGLFDGRYNNKVFADRIARLPLARQPGTLWRYGHSTDVLGRIIEILSGQTLYQFEKQHILDPLGMTSTKFVLESADERARMAEPLPGDTILKFAETERRTDPGNARPPPPGSIGELKWDSGSGTYFGVDPKLDMIYILLQQTQNERRRIAPAFKKLVYDAFATTD